MWNTSRKSPSTPITRRPSLLWGKRFALKFFLSLLILSAAAQAGPVLKVANGRVKELRLEKSEIVLSFFHPVNRREEELIFKVDNRTGFDEGRHLEDLKKGMPLTVDYQEEDGKARAVRVSKVPMRGVPFDKNPLLG